MTVGQWADWRDTTPYFKAIHTRFFIERALESLSEELLEELIGSGAARREGESLLDV